MNEEDLPSQVNYWLSPDTKHDCYFNVRSESGHIERIGTFKAFLIGYSEPLRAMLQDSELAEKGDISIVDIEPDTFREFLKCLYMSLTNKIIRNLTFQKCCDLLYVADKYLVSQLKRRLIEHCLNTLSPEISCINIACLSKVFMQEACLEMALSNLVRSKIRNVISSEQFLEITKDSLLWILTLDPLDIDELSLWNAVLDWAENKTNSTDGSTIRKCTLQLLKHIRFCGMNVKDFCKTVVPTNVLTNKEVYEICKYYGTNERPSMKFVCNDVTPRNLINYVILEPREISFSYCVTDIHNYTGTRKSTTFEYLNFNWHLLITRVDNYLGLYLECEGARIYDPSWKCCVKATLTLLNHNGINYSSTLPYNTFCRGNLSKGKANFYLWSGVFSPLMNFVKNNSITIMVTLLRSKTNKQY